MTGHRIIGIDPGPIPGIVVIDQAYSGQLTTHALQCTASIAGDLLSGLLAGRKETRVQIEKFVTGRATMRTGQAGEVTRDLIDRLGTVCQAHDVWCAVLRSASQVKPWATDTRLEAAGLLEATKGMRHARDAARHALFCAVHDAGVPDPLSKGAHR